MKPVKKRSHDQISDAQTAREKKTNMTKLSVKVSEFPGSEM